MFLSAGSLKDVLPLVEEMTRGPGKSLVRTAALVDSTLLALGALLARRGVGAFSVLVLALGAVFGVGILVFAIRRARLESRVEQWKRAGQATVAGEAASSSTDYSDRYRDAAQRSAIAAAGGVVNAPYLRDDLRITILSALVAAVAVPVGSFFAILAVLALL